MLNEILHQVRNSSASTRSVIGAESSSVKYQMNTTELPVLIASGINIERFNKLNPEVKAIVRLLIIYGLRANELLNLRCSDYLGNGLMLIRSLKNNRHKTIYSNEYFTYANHVCGQNGCRTYNTSYSVLYRAVRQVLQKENRFKKKTKETVTSTFRNQFIRNARNAKHLTETQVSDIIGHKSNQSQSYYLRGKLNGTN